MASVETREDAVKALHRMIVYVRDEATRLRITDAALLLGYAEVALLSCHAGRSADMLLDGNQSVPLVQH